MQPYRPSIVAQLIGATTLGVVLWGVILAVATLLG